MAKHYYEYDDGSIICTDGPADWVSGNRIPKAEGERKYQAQCARQLRKLLKPGERVYTTLKHVSSSGMSRHIDVYITNRGKTRADDCILCINSLVAGAIDERQARDGSIVMGGAGMDMGFAIVYSMGCAIWPKGTRRPHGTRNGEPDRHGGYALRHQWI